MRIQPRLLPLLAVFAVSAYPPNWINVGSQGGSESVKDSSNYFRMSGSV